MTRLYLITYLNFSELQVFVKWKRQWWWLYRWVVRVGKHFIPTSKMQVWETILLAQTRPESGEFVPSYLCSALQPVYYNPQNSNGSYC